MKPSGYKKIEQLLDNNFHVCETRGPKGPTKYIYPKNNDSKTRLIPCQKIIKINFKKNSNIKISKINNKDFVIGIAASGTTPYVIGAIKKCSVLNLVLVLALAVLFY